MRRYTVFRNRNRTKRSGFFTDEGSPLPELFTCTFTDNTFTEPFADPMLEEIEELGYNPHYDTIEEQQERSDD